MPSGVPRCIFSPNGQILGVGCALYNPYTLAIIWPFAQAWGSATVAFSSNSAYCVTSSSEDRESLVVLDVHDPSQVSVLQTVKLTVHIGGVMALSDNGSIALTSEESKLIVVPPLWPARIAPSKSYSLQLFERRLGHSAWWISFSRYTKMNKLICCCGDNSFISFIPSPLPTWPELKVLFIGWKKNPDCELAKLPVDVLQYIIEFAWNCWLPDPLKL